VYQLLGYVLNGGLGQALVVLQNLEQLTLCTASGSPSLVNVAG